MNINAIKHNDRKIKPPEMAVKGLFKGFRYITQIFDEEKDQQMQIGLPTDVKHVAHIGSDGPAANTPSWMTDFKPQDNDNGQVVSRGDTNKEQVGEGVGLQELLPPPEKPKKQKKTRRKSETLSQNGSPTRRKSSESLADMAPKPSRRHHKSRHESIDGNDPSLRRRRAVSSADVEGSYPLSDGGSHHSKKSSSRHRKLKGEPSMRKNKGKTENSTGQSVDACNNSVSDRD